jgi:hypothetical protein
VGRRRIGEEDVSMDEMIFLLSFAYEEKCLTHEF